MTHDDPPDTIDLRGPKAQVLARADAMLRAHQQSVHDQILADCVTTFTGSLEDLPDVLTNLQAFLADDAAGWPQSRAQAMVMILAEWDRLRDV